ncbi:uncharacterized protein LOC121785063 isoform X2 [Salvia splendens]|uniref:uncharacterized protein LOC121785063 isoform X2 n=1 Tax=Salvia splendens TaxID=180675 RepID=UPI001C275D5F|nr:uncharacterized protein LOC121785063 isoform X2 [Salvia splendens]
MDIFSSLQLSLELGIWSNYGTKTRFRLQNSESRGKFCVLRANLSSFSAFQEQCGWSRDLSKRIQRRACIISSRNHRLKCHCFVNRVPSFDAANIKSATSTLPRKVIAAGEEAAHFMSQPLTFNLYCYGQEQSTSAEHWIQ